MSYWLLKTEPETFGIDNLVKAKNQTTMWEGVRNYQARNFLQKEMKKGDLAFFYHSSCEVPGIAGIVEIVREGYPDETAFDSTSDYYDPKSTSNNPRWYRVDVKLVEKFKQLMPLHALRANPSLTEMKLLQKGNRLSVLPVSQQEWRIITKMVKAK